LVIVPNSGEPGEPAVESLSSPYLLFSATFDGDPDDYLNDLCTEMATEAQEIWSCCDGAPDPARGAPLKTYLQHNQVQTGLFFAAYADASVAKVKGALETRRKMISLAIRSQGMPPDDLRLAFREEFPP
jgi:hypothetical protein